MQWNSVFETCNFESLSLKEWNRCESILRVFFFQGVACCWRKGQRTYPCPGAELLCRINCCWSNEFDTSWILSTRGIGHNPQKPGFVMEHRHIENISGVQQGQMFQTYQAEHEGPSWTPRVYRDLTYWHSSNSILETTTNALGTFSDDTP